MLSGRGLCDELITRPDESYGPWCVVVCDLETSRIGAPYIHDIIGLRVKYRMTALHSLELQGKYLHRKPLPLCVIIREPSVFSDKLGKKFCHVSG